MSALKIKYGFIALLIGIMWMGGDAWAQKKEKKVKRESADSIQAPPQALLRRMGIDPTDSIAADSIARVNQEMFDQLEAPVDTAALYAKSEAAPMPTIEAPRWMPDPKRATWLALVIPGGGQIYNRKYWKLPIVYGGFVACAYALNFNSSMYSEYSQAYLDLMDDDPNTKSYEDFLSPNASIVGRESTYQTIFKKRKDYYRRYRDISIFCFIGVYVLSVIDAYVDAELSNFDISRDLGLRVEPTVIDNKVSKKSSVGLQCSITF